MSSISAVMCLYWGDSPSAFREAYESVLNQTMLPEEFILVVDGQISEEMESEVARLQRVFQTSPVMLALLRLKKNEGHGIARSKGVNLTNGEFIMICDADDLNVKTRFEKLHKTLISDPRLDVVGSNIVEVDYKSVVPLGIRAVACTHSQIVRQLKFRCPFNQMSVAIKKSSLQRVGGYKDFYHNEDYYLWIRMYLDGCRFANLREELVLARVNPHFYKRRGGFDYFKSEYRIQNLMFEKLIINRLEWLYNISVRFFVQVFLPNNLRAAIFRKLMRQRVK